MIIIDVGRYILEARKRALAKKKKLRSLGKRAQSADSEDEMEVDGELIKVDDELEVDGEFCLQTIVKSKIF